MTSYDTRLQSLDLENASLKQEIKFLISQQDQSLLQRFTDLRRNLDRHNQYLAGALKVCIDRLTDEEIFEKLRDQILSIQTKADMLDRSN